MAKASLQQAEKAKIILRKLNSSSANKLIEQWSIFIPRVKQVIEQASRRVFKQEKVAAAEKIVSIFEVHTAIICQGYFILNGNVVMVSLIKLEK